MNAEQKLNQWDQIVAKAWQDDKFKKRLVNDPAAVVKEFGLEVAPGIQLRVVENTDTIVNLTLPSQPADGELADNELATVAGGAQRPEAAAARRALMQGIKALLDSMSPESKGIDDASSTPSHNAALSGRLRPA